MIRLARLQAAIDGVLIAAIDGEGRFEGFLRNFPHRFVVGVGVAMSDEQTVQEFEEVSRDSKRAECIDQPLFAN
jgi:hypothetical protein